MPSQGYLRQKLEGTRGDRSQGSFLRLAQMSTILLPSYAFAGNFEGSLQSLVNGVVGRILPLIAFFYAGEAAIHWIQNKPDAKDKASRVAVGTIALLGINGVWSWLQSHVR